ncbi:MAG: serine/threonine-protein kinase [Polyangia bacterium]
MSSPQEDPPIASRCADCGERLVEGQPHECAQSLRSTAFANTLAAAGEQSTLPEPGAVVVGKQGDATTGLLGQVLGERYEIQKVLGQGGMGVVFQARHVKLEKLLAVKLLLTPQNEEYQRRFLQEAQLASRINHPNTVFMSDYGVLPDGRPYIVMEFLRGPTLASEIGKGPLDPLRVCQIGAQIARGLQTVHEQGIIHRDLKPDNVFLIEQDGKRDVVKIVDFGIAKKTGAGPEDSVTAARDAASKLSKQRLSSETLPGTLMGTPAYMAPEMAQGLPVDARVDQYALGVMLYERPRAVGGRAATFPAVGSCRRGGRGTPARRPLPSGPPRSARSGAPGSARWSAA